MDYKIELVAPISRTGEKPHRQEFLICRTGKDSSGKTFTEYLKEFSNDINKSPLELIDEISKNPGDYSWTSDSESAFLIEYDDETKANIKAINDYANKLKAKKAYDDLVANKYSHPNKGVDMRINSSKDYYESLNSKDASFARQMLKEDGFQPLKNEDFKDSVYETYVKPDPPDDYYFNYANHDFGWYDEVILYIDDDKISNVGQIYGSKLWNVEKYGIDFSNMKINSSNYVVALSPEGGNKSVIYGPSSQDDAKAFYDNYKASHNDDDVSVMTEESWQKVNSSKAVKSDVDGTMRQIKQVVDNGLGFNTQLDGNKAFIRTPNNLIEIDYSKDDDNVYFAVMDNSDNYVQDGFSLEKTDISELPKRIQKLMDKLHDKTYVKSSFAIAVSGTNGKGYIGANGKLVEDIKDAVKYDTQREADDKRVELQKKTTNTDYWTEDTSTMEKTRIQGSRAIKSDLAQDIFDSFNGLSYQDAVNKMKIEGYTLVGYGNYNFSEGTIYETYAKGTPTDAEEIELIFNTKNGNATTVDDAILLGEHEDLPAEAAYLLAQGQDYLDSSAIKEKINMTKTDKFVASMLAKGMVDNVEMLANGYDIEKGNNKVSIRCNGSNAIIWNHKDSNILEIQSARLDDILHRYIVKSCLGLQSKTNDFGTFTNATFIPDSIVSNRLVLSDASGKKWICSDSTPRISFEFYNTASLVNADDCLLLLPDLIEYAKGFKVSLNSSCNDEETKLHIMYSSVNPEDYAVYPVASAVMPVGKTVIGNFICSASDKAAILSFESAERYIDSSGAPLPKSAISSSLRTTDSNVRQIQSAIVKSGKEKLFSTAITRRHGFLSSRALETAMACEGPAICKEVGIDSSFDYKNLFTDMQKHADTATYTLTSAKEMRIDLDRKGVFSARFVCTPDVEALRNLAAREGILFSDLQKGTVIDNPAEDERSASFIACSRSITPVVDTDRYFKNSVVKLYGKDCSQHLAKYGIKDSSLFSSITQITMDC